MPLSLFLRHISTLSFYTFFLHFISTLKMSSSTYFQSGENEKQTTILFNMPEDIDTEDKRLCNRYLYCGCPRNPDGSINCKTYPNETNEEKDKDPFANAIIPDCVAIKITTTTQNPVVSSLDATSRKLLFSDSIIPDCCNDNDHDYSNLRCGIADYKCNKEGCCRENFCCNKCKDNFRKRYGTFVCGTCNKKKILGREGCWLYNRYICHDCVYQEMTCSCEKCGDQMDYHWNYKVCDACLKSSEDNNDKY